MQTRQSTAQAQAVERMWERYAVDVDLVRTRLFPYVHMEHVDRVIEAPLANLAHAMMRRAAGREAEAEAEAVRARMEREAEAAVRARGSQALSEAEVDACVRRVYAHMRYGDE